MCRFKPSQLTTLEWIFKISQVFPEMFVPSPLTTLEWIFKISQVFPEMFVNPKIFVHWSFLLSFVLSVSRINHERINGRLPNGRHGQEVTL